MTYPAALKAPGLLDIIHKKKTKLVWMDSRISAQPSTPRMRTKVRDWGKNGNSFFGRLAACSSSGGYHLEQRQIWLQEIQTVFSDTMRKPPIVVPPDGEVPSPPVSQTSDLGCQGLRPYFGLVTLTII